MPLPYTLQPKPSSVVSVLFDDSTNDKKLLSLSNNIDGENPPAEINQIQENGYGRSFPTQ